MASTRVVIDTDPGVDDAVAILFALASDALDVVGITTVAGNVNVDRTTLNARRTLDLARRPDIPVSRGAAAALNGFLRESPEVHGADGLGGLTWPEPSTPEDPRTAVQLIHQLASEGPLTIVAIGPLTNLALALREYPVLATTVERVVVMGGASCEGNVTPAAEFNVWADPEAAREVFAATWPLVIMPLDLTHQAFTTDDDLAYFRSLGTEIGQRVADMLEPYAEFHQEWYGSRDTIMHDAMALYEVMFPDAIESEGCEVQVETGGEFARGATFFSRGHRYRDSTTRVGVSVENDLFRARLRQAMVSLD